MRNPTALHEVAAQQFEAVNYFVFAFRIVAAVDVVKLVRYLFGDFHFGVIELMLFVASEGRW